MFTKIFGSIWIVAGIFFVLKPQMLKRSIQRKSLKRIRKYFIMAAILLGAMLISLGRRFHGPLAGVVVILGIISVVKGFFFVKAKSADKIVGWFAERPLVYFRIGGCFYILTGIAVLLLR